MALSEKKIQEEHKFEFPYLSQNRAYEIHSKGRKKWIGKTSNFKNFENEVKAVVMDKMNGINTYREPVIIWHTLILKRCHRSKKHLDGLPMADVGNNIKVIHDAIEGVLIEDDSQIVEAHAKKKAGDENKVLTTLQILEGIE